MQNNKERGDTGNWRGRKTRKLRQKKKIKANKLLLLCLNATEKLKISNKRHKTNWWRWWRTMLRIFKKVGAEVEKAMHETEEAEFRQDDVPKTLEKSGKKPVLAVSAIAQGIPRNFETFTTKLKLPVATSRPRISSSQLLTNFTKTWQRLSTHNQSEATRS